MTAIKKRGYDCCDLSDYKIPTVFSFNTKIAIEESHKNVNKIDKRNTIFKNANWMCAVLMEFSFCEEKKTHVTVLVRQVRYYLNESKLDLQLHAVLFIRFINKPTLTSQHACWMMWKKERRPLVSNIHNNSMCVCARNVAQYNKINQDTDALLNVIQIKPTEFMWRVGFFFLFFFVVWNGSRYH